jgi:hypothetical protein
VAPGKQSDQHPGPIQKSPSGYSGSDGCRWIRLTLDELSCIRYVGVGKTVRLFDSFSQLAHVRTARGTLVTSVHPIRRLSLSLALFERPLSTPKARKGEVQGVSAQSYY